MVALAELPGPGMLRSRGSARSTVGTIGLDRCGADGYHELDTLADGMHLADVVAWLGSMDLVLGEIDR